MFSILIFPDAPSKSFSSAADPQAEDRDREASVATPAGAVRDETQLG